MRKAQIQLTDFFIGLVIVLIVLSLLFNTWNRYSLMLDRKVEFENLKHTAFQVSDMLVLTTGKPNCWEDCSTDMGSIGLVQSDRNLSDSKINAFNAMDYTSAQDIIGIRGYGFQVNIYASNGTLMNSTGVSPSGDYSVALTRYVRYKNKPARLRVVLFAD